MILITGGFGFLGSTLMKQLGENATEYRQDIRKPFSYAKPFSVTQLYNLAGTPTPVKYLEDPTKTLATNTVGTINVMEFARKYQVKVLQASTGEVIEESSHLDSRACYRFGKRVAETICMDYHRQYGIDVKILRMYNSYGPGMKIDDGRVIPEFIRKAINGEDIIVFGGRQTRSFCYVDDMIDGMIKMMNSDLTGPVNICNPEEISIYELAEFIVSECGSKSKIIYNPRRKEDQNQINPTIDLAQDCLGWLPQVSLEEGLKLTINNFKKRMGYVGKGN